jgi:DNA modification methylase
MNIRAAPGQVRDSIVGYLSTTKSASIAEILQAVQSQLGDVPSSSVRSYLNANTPVLFERVSRGRYKLRLEITEEPNQRQIERRFGRATFIHGNCLDWMRTCDPVSISAIVTDPPYGLVEYTEREQEKLREGKGGVWRIPPSFDGHKRSPLPRFTILSETDRTEMYRFFFEFGLLAFRVLRPGANIIIASNPLFVHIVANALNAAGLELRGHIVRLVMTMRGGDRPKNAHEEFQDVSVMPRSMFEPWVILRRPLEGRVQDNLRKWRTGGFRRLSGDRPFGDVIRSHPTPPGEKKIAPHPSLKPQSFLRALVRAVLPLGEGVILDPFAGSGSTLAAANALGHASIGVEKDAYYVAIASRAIPKLAELAIKPIDPITS